MIIFLISLVMLLVIFLWSACVVSSSISKEEEKYEYEKVQKTIDKFLGT